MRPEVPDELMRLMVSRPDIVRARLLTDRDIEHYKLVRNAKGLTSAGLSVATGISPQNASTSLCRLYNRGYLDRENIGSESGGDEFLYKTAL